MESHDNMESSGGTRYSKGKPGGWWYAPLNGLSLVAPVWTMGSAKYAPMDWKEGQSFSMLMDCATRHWLKVLDKGPWAINKADGGVLHLGQNVWNTLTLLALMEAGRDDCNDVDKWRGITAALKQERGMEFKNAG